MRASTPRSSRAWFLRSSDAESFDTRPHLRGGRAGRLPQGFRRLGAGGLFGLSNRRRDRVKVLAWDRNGFWLHYKRLERGTFERVEGDGKRLELDRARMTMLLEGIDSKNTRFRRNFARDVRINARDDRDARAAR